jgi:hypothetical protein
MKNSKRFLNLEDELYANLSKIEPAVRSIKTSERELKELKKELDEKRKAMNSDLSKAIKAFDKLMGMELTPEHRVLVVKMGWNLQKTVNIVGKYID